ncbi:MAG: hypothetical protein ACTMKY_00830 [Dermabacteraceae bacterium]|uniref:hypothetical protein n=1 Tax=Brachybacterium TaxID=43668 RepID=UPI003F924A7E
MPVPTTVPTDEPRLWGMTAAEVADRVEAARPRWILTAKLIEAEHAWAHTPDR